MIFDAYLNERAVAWDRPGGGKRRFKSARNREFDATLVHWMREEAVRCGWVMPTEGDVVMCITLHFASRPGDLDNYIKLIQDAGNRVLYADDRQIQRLTIDRKRSALDGVRLTVRMSGEPEQWPAKRVAR